MARKTRRRYYKHRGRWCSNIQEIPQTQYTVANSPFGDSITLVTNPIQATTGVSQIYTVKNIEVSMVAEIDEDDASPNDFEDLTYYIMYVPQGMNLTTDYNIEHPEYIMAYKYLGSPTLDGNQQYQPVKIKTRLARKLNTGDQIILFFKGRCNAGMGSNRIFRLGGLVRWWTKAN